MKLTLGGTYETYKRVECQIPVKKMIEIGVRYHLQNWTSKSGKIKPGESGYCEPSVDARRS